LQERGILFDALPAWQRRGAGLWWENYEKTGVNPLTGESAVAIRRRVKLERELPFGEDYADLLLEFMNGAN
jgi:tRNA(His) 5'-end guanylyltransferase